MAHAMSPQRHIDKLTVPIVVSYGVYETPEFQRQARDFAAARQGDRQAGRAYRGLIHDQMGETLGKPYTAPTAAPPWQ
jgi:arylformamidase